MTALGLCYYQGIGVEKDVKRAVELYRQGVGPTPWGAMTNLVFCNHQGIGVEKDLKRAVEFYRQGGEAGNKMARVPLAVLSATGAIDRPLPLATGEALIPDLHLAGDPVWVDRPSIKGKWEDVKPGKAKAVIGKLVGAAALEGYPELFANRLVTAMREFRLACYPGLSLVEVQLTQSDAAEKHLLTAIVSMQGAILLDGTALRLQTLNGHVLDIETDEAKEQYLRMYCEFVRSDEGPFSIVSSLDDIPFETEEACAAFSATNVAITPPILVTTQGESPNGLYSLDANVLYGNALFQARFSVASNGQVDMLGDDRIAINLPIRRRHYDSFFRTPLMDVVPPTSGGPTDKDS